MTAVLLVLLLLVALGGTAAVGSYNRLVRRRHLVAESWRQVDVELRRRHDLVPGLVSAVSAHAAHERAVLDAVLTARRHVAESGPVAEDELSCALGRVVALAEAYPVLRSDHAFGRLQAQLAETEDRLAAARRFYNGNVRAYNTRLQTFPSSVVAARAGFEPATYFEVHDPVVRAPVPVALDLPARPPLPPG